MVEKCACAFWKNQVNLNQWTNTHTNIKVTQKQKKKRNSKTKLKAKTKYKDRKVQNLSSEVCKWSRSASVYRRISSLTEFEIDQLGVFARV